MAAQLPTRVEEASGDILRLLVFGDVAHQYPVKPHPAAPLLVVGLAGEVGGETRALEFVPKAQTAAHSVEVINVDGTRRTGVRPENPLVTWDSTGFTVEFEAYLRTVFGLTLDGNDTTSNLSPLGPLLLLRTHMEARPFTEVLVVARVRAAGTLFARIGRFEHGTSPEAADLIARALSLAEFATDRVRIEGNSYVTFEEGIEIEQKVNLLDDVSIWGVTKTLWAAVESGKFPGFITDPGYELTRWNFLQHNFEVLGPPEEVGHLAFQKALDGRYNLKHKRFFKDAKRREELFRLGIEIYCGDLDRFLAREYPELELRRLPSFARTRFDVNVQSMITGHYFGIETDEVTVWEGSEKRKLRQVEIEYLETRWHEGISATTIDADLSRLADLVEEEMGREGVATQSTHYSKLSFLRDCLKSRES